MEDSLRIGMTRAPGIRPRMSPVGIKNNLSPEKPTTSASICLPSAVSTRQRPPTAACAAHCFQRHADHSIERAFHHEFGRARRAPACSNQGRVQPLRRPQTRSPGLAHLTRRASPWPGVRYPASSLRMPPSRVSRRASIRDVAVVIWHPPRAITGSSTMVQARSFSVGDRCCLTTAASSGCRCTRTSRSQPPASRQRWLLDIVCR